MSKLEGRIAIVTGGTSGMGRGIAELFAREGAKVVVGGRSETRGRDVVDAIQQAGGEAVFVAGDVADVDTNQRLVDTAVDVFGGVDLLVPNAGVLGIGGVKQGTVRESIDIWRATLETNLSAVYYLIRIATPRLLERERGSIVVNGSIAAYTAFPNHPAYCASKGALVPLVRQLAIDLAPTVRVNMLCPGQVDTPLLWDSARAFDNPQTVVQEVADAMPLRRLGTADDIAKAALFLACDDSSWITGSALTIDGGVLTKA